MDLKALILSNMNEILEEKGAATYADISPDAILLETGLDSLDFAVLVVKLEMALGFDPFAEMAVPVYPRTFAEFLKIYTEHES